MPKTVSATDAKNKLGSVVSWVLENQDEIIVESRGEPTVVIMPYAEYEKVKDLRERDDRRQALEQLRSLRDEVRARNQDLTSEVQALAIADEVSREAIESLIEKRKIKYRREQEAS
ncbi:MAG TPA: type II toxin-antitoxin system Phd/YefM family antitoxin [Chloroflexia bacterium]|nr:type II toxin-antitoxin system Phd/YefM family antitoxin [Chloroflexia bacterium]